MLVTWLLVPFSITGDVTFGLTVVGDTVSYVPFVVTFVLNVPLAFFVLFAFSVPLTNELVIAFKFAFVPFVFSKALLISVTIVSSTIVYSLFIPFFSIIGIG